jgi:acyl-CoA thioesterase-2
MPASADELVALLDIESLDVDLFRGRQPETDRQRVFGGQVAAQALIAGIRTVPEDRHVHSLHSYFLRPGDTSVPIIYDVERLRDGRSFATRRIVARRSPEAAEHWKREWAALGLKYVGDSSARGGIPGDEQPAQSRLWLRICGNLPDDPVLHRAAFTYASDMTLLGATLVGHGVTIGDPRLQPASLDHSLWFHRPFRADEWWLYDQWSPSASGARGLALARVFTQDGTLVATVAQEGLIRMRDGVRDSAANSTTTL